MKTQVLIRAHATPQRTVNQSLFPVTGTIHSRLGVNWLHTAFRTEIVMLVVALVGGLADADAAIPSPIRFEKQVLTDQYFCDGINAGDFDRDGRTDVVAGPFWYERPDFKRKHEFYPGKPFETTPSPTDSMFSYVHDFNGDGWPDVLVLSRGHVGV